MKTKDGLHIHTIHWLPSGDPKAIVLLIHGIGEHSGRYTHVADTLTQAGYAVYALDHRGHGQSEGLRTHFDSFDQPVADLEQYYAEVKAAHPDKKIFVYGHSMGSFISFMFVLKHQSELAGWISTGTPIDLFLSLNPIVLAVGGFIGRIAPKIPLAPGNSSTLSRDQAVVDAFDNDPLNSTKPTRAGMAEKIAMGGKALRTRAPELQLPILIMHGSADTLTPPSGSQYLYDHAGSMDKNLKLYEGLYHEIHNEPEKATVLYDIVTWLDQH